MTWAWATPLPPTSKLILMALADIADDHGICWPSHRTLALKCTLSDRTVRRTLGKLHALKLLVVEARTRKNGSSASNCYRLAVDALPPGQIVLVGGQAGPGGRSSVTREGDMAILPRTTNEPSIDSPPRRPGSDSESDAVRANTCGGGEFFFPRGLTDSQRHALRDRLAKLTSVEAQQVLDELTGRMAVTPVKNPIRYCAVLASRMKRGAFAPELGLKIADARQADCAPTQQMTPAEGQLDLTKLPRDVRETIERLRTRARAPQPLDAKGGN
jgi:Helix-turn-helix domain